MTGNAANCNLGAMLRSSAQRWPHSDALIFPDSRQSYADLNNAARRWARYFIAAGIQPGQNIGILLTTRPEFVEILFGIFMAGGVAVPINARYQASELRFLVRDADISILVSTGHVSDSLDFGERLLKAFPSLPDKQDGDRLELDDAPLLRSIICLDDPCPAYLTQCNAALNSGAQICDDEVDARINDVTGEDTAMILYTSGTTANPKGALISHMGQLGNSRNLGRRYEMDREDKVWSPLPVFHIAGILPMVMILDLGGAYMTVPHFEAGQALAMLDREKATLAYPSFVTIMQDLITHEKFESTDLGSLRIMNSNFAVQPAWIRDAVVKAMPDTIQVGTYGLTEAAGTVSTSRLTDSFEARTQRCGVLLDDWEMKILDADTGKEMEAGERGEIVLRGPHMLKGYYNAPQKTAEVMRGGWFHTGDIGSIDADGNVMFHGRMKDMLKVGGENVAAAEIESMLQTHPCVKLAQVVGVPDDRYVEVAAAFIELNTGDSVDADALIAHCKGELASFKIPRHIRFVDAWPMSTSKIQKFKLQTQLCKELGKAD